MSVKTALLDFQQYPGKYPVGHHQPALLFASIPLILQLAAGKSSGADDPHLKRAACFFVRTALLYPGADHYALLGLTRNSGAASLKEHYRLLMRLVHPDFAGNLDSSWPADAAARLNLAYEVLGSEPRRALHDEQLAAASSPRPQRSPIPRPSLKAPPAKFQAADPRLVLKLLAGGFGVAGAAGVGMLVLLSDSDKDSLVQKPLHAAVAAFSAPPTMPPIMAAPSTAEVVTATFRTAAQPVLRAPPMPAAARPAAARPLGVSIAAPAPPNPNDFLPSIPAAIAPSAPPVDAAVAAVPAAPVALAVQAPPAATPVAAPNPGLTLMEAQPLLATLLQYVQRGQGGQLLTLLDRDARKSPAALALSRRLDALAEGAHPIKLSHVEFRAEPAEGRLIVTGHMQLHTGEPGSGAPGKKLSVRAEFAARQGTVVMTALSALGGN